MPCEAKKWNSEQGQSRRGGGGGGEGASAPLAPQKMTFKRATTLTLLSLIPLDMGKEKQKSIPTITNLYH